MEAKENLLPSYCPPAYLRFMGYFTNKKVWITGASSGIGKAAAQALNAAGAEVLLSARREDLLYAVKESCSIPERVHILPIDLEKSVDAKLWLAEALQLMGGLDILLANAGIGQSGYALDTLDEVERKIFEINYHGHLKLSKTVLQHFLQQGGGQIMAIASIAGKFGQRKLAAYSASKAALLLYYESLWQELKSEPIKLQVVSPGFINTEVTLNSLDTKGERLNKNSKAQENGMPAEVFAQKLLKVMEGKRFHSYIGGKELLAVPLHAISPQLFYKLLG